ncbi:hypothetical protein [Haloglomus litoreum]|uniref:hypothetical protein n=1 Tax=Haloglomus litoreum TaxID=3034026 RepID=UPI0023E7BE91|nr:hypothetical protein [Haloglomus sp. DT116]
MTTGSDGAAHGIDPGALVRYLKRRFDDGFRSCVVYDDDGATVHFVRGDISEAAVHSRLERVKTLTEAGQAAQVPDELDPEFGPLHAATYVFGEALVVHLLVPDGSVVGISMDHAIGGHLTSFVRDCIEVLYVSDPPDSNPVRDRPRS